MSEKIQFFGEVDRNPSQPNMGMGSDYPAYYFDNPTGAMANLKEEIRQLEQQNHRGAISHEQVMKNKVEIEKRQAKYDAIVASKPKLSGVDEEKVDGWIKEMDEKVADAMFTYKEDARGTASPQEEVRRTTQPCVDVPKALATACGMEMSGGGSHIRVTRTQAEKMLKIARKVRGRRTNLEMLRREG